MNTDDPATITADRDAARELRDSEDRGTRLIAGVRYDDWPSWDEVD